MVDLFKKTVQRFDYWLGRGEDTKVTNFILKENEGGNKIDLSSFFEVPNLCHFVWIGHINMERLEYLKIWNHHTETINLWIDSETKYSPLREEILSFICKKHKCNIIKSQNILYKYARLNNLSSLDEVLLKYSSDNFPEIIFKFEKLKNEYYDKLSILSKYLIVNDCREHFCNLIYDNCFLDYYFYETLLRGNFAAASDILRLLILRLHGGIYIDVDTLPCINNSTMNSHKVNSSILNLIDVVFSHNISSRYDLKSELNNPRLLHCINLVNNSYPGLLKELEENIFERAEFKQLTYPRVHRDLLSISGSKNKLDEFNNNIIASHPNSKAIKLVLREMKKRYRHCENNGYIFDDIFHETQGVDGYYQRLINYRQDGLNDKLNEEITLILTGPSLILEVMIGAAYQIFGLDDDINPIAVSYAFRLNSFGLSYQQQTMFTLKHLDSSWMAR